MKSLRWILPGLALTALAGTGCILLSTQIFAHFNLTNPFTINSAGSTFQREAVDLSTVKDYKDNKDKLKGLSDIALVGKFTNVAGPAGSVEVWITAGTTNLASVAAIQGGSTKLWSASIGAAPAVLNIGWNESAKHFNAAGKKILIDQVLGTGIFTIYVIGTAGSYQIKVDNGAIILVIAAGV